MPALRRKPTMTPETESSPESPNEAPAREGLASPICSAFDEDAFWIGVFNGLPGELRDEIGEFLAFSTYDGEGKRIIDFRELGFDVLTQWARHVSGEMMEAVWGEGKGSVVAMDVLSVQDLFETFAQSVFKQNR